MEDIVIWIGIFLCLSQSAMFSGLNLAFFSISRLRLEIEAANNNPEAKKVLALRENSNLLLATVLWGNVAVNVLLTLLSDSVMFGVSAFLFSTFAITIGGEILPQAYFSRNALRMAAMLSPVLRFYQMLLYVVTRPTAYCLDQWLGAESVQYMRERELRQLIHRHIDATESDVDAAEGIGALNFLAIDDVLLRDEGETLAVESIISLPLHKGSPLFFDINASDKTQADAFLTRIGSPKQRWIIVTGPSGAPEWALNAHDYLLAVAYSGGSMIDPMRFCHRPVVVTDPATRLGAVIGQFKPLVAAHSDAGQSHRIVLFWGKERRIITSSDILERLFKGIDLFSSINRAGNRES